jgi:hypothetical protein
LTPPSDGAALQSSAVAHWVNQSTQLTGVTAKASNVIVIKAQDIRFGMPLYIQGQAVQTKNTDTPAALAKAINQANAGVEAVVNSTGELIITNNVKSNDISLNISQLPQNNSATSLPLFIKDGSAWKQIPTASISTPEQLVAAINGANTRHIAVTNSVFTQKMDINTIGFNNNDILIDGNTFNSIGSGGGTEGRLNVYWPGGPGTVPAGVTVSNNTFDKGGCSDGIQLGAYGVVVGPGNYFGSLTQGSCTEHVDAIQGYGQSHSVIRGNYFVRPRVCLGFYDGGTAEVFENNVFVGNGVDGTQCVIDLGSVTSASFKHNTLSGVSPRVGGINSSAGGSGTYTENIMIGSSFNGGPASSCSSCTFTHNLFSSGGNGTNNLTGTPTFTGGSLPTTLAGWQLASSSIGYRAALDATDMGALIGSTTAPAPVTLTPPASLRVLP